MQEKVNPNRTRVVLIGKFSKERVASIAAGINVPVVEMSDEQALTYTGRRNRLRLERKLWDHFDFANLQSVSRRHGLHF